MTIRHQAACDLLRERPAPDGWEMIRAVVAPSEKLREESERRARRLLAERAAA